MKIGVCLDRVEATALSRRSTTSSPRIAIACCVRVCPDQYLEDSHAPADHCRSEEGSSVGTCAFVDVSDLHGPIGEMLAGAPACYTV